MKTNCSVWFVIAFLFPCNLVFASKNGHIGRKSESDESKVNRSKLAATAFTLSHMVKENKFQVFDFLSERELVRYQRLSKSHQKDTLEWFHRNYPLEKFKMPDRQVASISNYIPQFLSLAFRQSHPKLAAPEASLKYFSQALLPLKALEEVLILTGQFNKNWILSLQPDSPADTKEYHQTMHHLAQYLSALDKGTLSWRFVKELLNYLTDRKLNYGRWIAILDELKSDALKESAPVQELIAYCLIHGIGTKRDLKEAKLYAEKAAPYFKSKQRYWSTAQEKLSYLEFIFKISKGDQEYYSPKEAFEILARRPLVQLQDLRKVRDYFFRYHHYQEAIKIHHQILNQPEHNSDDIYYAVADYYFSGDLKASVALSIYLLESFQREKLKSLIIPLEMVILQGKAGNQENVERIMSRFFGNKDLREVQLKNDFVYRFFYYLYSAYYFHRMIGRTDLATEMLERLAAESSNIDHNEKPWITVMGNFYLDDLKQGPALLQDVRFTEN